MLGQYAGLYDLCLILKQWLLIENRSPILYFTLMYWYAYTFKKKLIISSSWSIIMHMVAFFLYSYTI